MASVAVVLELESIKIDSSSQKQFHVFQCMDGVFNSPLMANAVAIGETPDHVPFDDINMLAERKIVKHFRPLLDSFRRQLIVIELQAFPYIQCHLDSENQREFNSGDNSKFARDVVSVWETYDQSKEIPIIILNTDTGACGLKRHNFI